MIVSFVQIRMLFALTFVTAIAACGGGGGGSGVPVDPENVENGNPGSEQNEPVVINTGIIMGPCSADLKEILDTASTSVRLSDLGSGCDYFVEDFASIRTDLTVDAGVAFLMGDGASLVMRGNAVEMNGTASQPIVFQGVDNVPGAWEGLAINGPTGQISSASLNYVSVSGASGTGRNDAALDVISTDLSMTNSSIILSSGNAVYVEGSGTEIVEFNANSFNSNQGHPLVLSTIRLAEGLDASSDFVGASSPNAKPEVLIDSRTGVNTSFGPPVIIKDIDTEYLFNDSLDMGSGGLVIEAGVDIRFAPDEGLKSDGTFYALGEPARPITFGLRSGATGDWQGLTLSGTSVIDNFEVIGGGSGQGSLGGSVSIPNLSFGTALVRLSNGVITNSRGFGFFCTSGFDLETIDVKLLEVGFQDSLAGDIHPSCVGLESVENSENSAPVSNPSPLTIADPLSQCAETFIGETVRDPSIFNNSASDCDVYILGNVSFNSTAFIEAGTTFLMAPESSVEFGGTLTANGTQQDTIKFLSRNDTAGDWRGIEISDNIASQFSYVDIYNAGIANPVFARGSNTSGNVNGAALTLSGTAPEGQGMQVSEVSVTRSAGHGIYLDDRLSGLGSFGSNVFIDVTLADLAIHAEHVGLLDDTNVFSTSLEPASGPVIEIKDDSSQRTGFRFIGTETRLSPLGGPWFIPNLAVAGSLFIEAGTEIQFGENGRLLAAGSVEIAGTDTMPVTLTGQVENELRWAGLEILGTANITHATLIGGGEAEGRETTFSTGNTQSFSPTSQMEGTIQIRFPDSPVSISDTTVRGSYGFGIKCSGTDAGNFVLTRPTFENNASGDLDPDCGVQPTN